MKLRLEDIYLVVDTKEELNNVSLIFQSYGYYWRNIDEIAPLHEFTNERHYVTLCSNSLSGHHLEKGYRISFSTSKEYVIEKSKHKIEYNDFITNY